LPRGDSGLADYMPIKPKHVEPLTAAGS